MRNKFGHDTASPWRQSASILALVVGAGALVFAAGAPARADDAAVAKLEKEMHRLEAQHAAEIKALRVQIKEIQARKGGPVVAAPGGVVTKGPYEPCLSPFVTMTPNHEFGLSSCDGQNTINFTGRVHIDTGGYVGYSRNGTTAAAAAGLPGNLASGVNVRRARIGVQGKFMGDWDYALIYDFGGSSDGFASTGLTSYNNVSYVNGQLPGGGVSGIENAFVTYKGFYNHHQPFPVAITLGVIDVPWTVGEAMSSNDLPMLERPTPQVIATQFGGGDNRTAIGATSNDNNYFLGTWLTGPTTGALHEIGSAGLGPQFAALARAAYTFDIDKANNATVHIGGNYAYTWAPRSGANLEAFALSDRPELRVDPTTFFSETVPSSSGHLFGAEFAASYQNAFFQAEYYHYLLNTKIGTFGPAAAAAVPGSPLGNNVTGAFAPVFGGGTNGPAYNFDGGYAQASYTFGGHRHYNPASGGYSGVVPDKPFLYGTDGFGALEIVGTFGAIDSNDQALANLVVAGTGYSAYTGQKQFSYGGGLNWYPNLNVKVMLDYEHIDYQGHTALFTTRGANIDWVAARTQFMW